MIFPDSNLLLYAEDSLSKHHQRAREWWDGVLSASEPVHLCWPLTSGEAIERVGSWLDHPCVRRPSSRYGAVFSGGLLIQCALALMVALAGFLLLPFLPSWLNVGAELRGEFLLLAAIQIMITALSIPVRAVGQSVLAAGR